MALGMQGVDKSDIQWGLITKVELRKIGTGSFVDCGRLKNANFALEPLVMKSDPADSDHVYAVRYTVSFDLLQSALASELTLIAGTDGTGLYETDMEVKLTFASGRTVTLGTSTAAPLRLTPRFVAGVFDDAQTIPITGSNVEGISTFVAKVTG